MHIDLQVQVLQRLLGGRDRGWALFRPKDTEGGRGGWESGEMKVRPLEKSTNVREGMRFKERNRSRYKKQILKVYED